MPRRPLRLLPAILLLALVSCVAPGPPPPTPTPRPPTAVPQPTVETPAMKARAAVAEGQAAVAEGDLRAAEAKYREALALDPRSGAAYAALSRLHLDLGAHDQEALAEAQQAVELAPGELSSWISLTYALARERRGPEAEAAARKALLLKGQNGPSLAALSAAQLVQRKPAEALENARLAVKRDSDLPEAYLALADAYWEQGDFARATAALEKTVALQPRNLAHRARLGVFQTHLLRFDHAAATFSQVLDQAAATGLAYLPARHGQMNLALMSGDMPALEDLTAGRLAAAPADAVALMGRAAARRRAGKLDEAEAAYRALLAADPQDFDARLGLAGLQLERNECAAAAQSFAALAAEQPRLADPLVGQARAAQCAGDGPRAQALLQAALELEPCNGQALTRLAALQLALGADEAGAGAHLDQARALYGRALRCSPSPAIVQMEIGQAALQIGHGEAAAEAFETARRLNPRQLGVDLGLCLAQLGAGDAHAAAASCEQAGRDPLAGNAATLPHAHALLASGRYTDVVSLLEPLAGQLAAEPAFHQHLGVSYVHLGNYPAALERFTALEGIAAGADARRAGLVAALAAGWELSREAAVSQLAGQLTALARGRPRTVTLDDGPDGRQLAVRLKWRPGEDLRQLLGDAAQMAVLAGRVAPRLAPPATGGVAIHVVDEDAAPLYTLLAGPENAAKLALLQQTDGEFIAALRLVDHSAAAPFSTADVRAIGAEVARLRGLPAPSDVPLVRLSQAGYAAHLNALDVSSALNRADASALEILLGLLEPGADLTRLEIDQTAASLTGVYEHDAGRFLLIGQRPGAWQDRLTIAHEYAHALQDREFATPYLWDRAAGEDMQLALRSLEEGDAELAEQVYGAEWLPVDPDLAYAWTVGEGPALAAEAAAQAVPAFLEELALFPYDAGFEFVRSIHDAEGWAGVNRAFGNPPVSSEQILHPDLYRAGHLPVAVGLPPLARTLGEGWGVAETGVLGEAGWQVALAPFTGRVAAAAAAAGWGGDRYALLRRADSGDYAAAFHTAWDDAGEAAEFEALARVWLDQRTGGAQVVADLTAAEPARRWVQGWTQGAELHWFMRRDDDRVIIVVAPGEALANTLLAAQYPTDYQCHFDTPAQEEADLGPVLAKVSQAIDAQPRPALLRQRANLHLLRGDFAAGVADLTAAIALDDDDPTAYIERGRAHYFAAAYDAALADLARGLDLRPDDYDARVLVGLVYGRKGDYAQAEQTFSEALDRFPRDPYLYEHRGDVYWATGEHDLAIADYQKGAALLPDYADPECERGWLLNSEGHVWYERGDNDRALAAFNAAVKLRPGDAEAWCDLGDLYAEQDQLGKARAAYKQALDAQPELGLVHRKLGYLSVYEGDYDAALAAFNKAIALEPDSAEGYYGRGYAYLERGWTRDEAGQSLTAVGDYWNAILEFNWVLKLDPEMASAYYRRGQAYAARGDIAAAIANYTSAIARDPAWADPYYTRGWAYVEQGDKARAISDFEKYLEIGDDEAAREELEQELKELRG